MRRFFTLAVMTTVVRTFCLSFDLRLRGQQPQVQPAAALPAGRGGIANNEAISDANAPFVTHCAGCQGGGQVPNAPDVSALRQMTPEQR